MGNRMSNIATPMPQIRARFTSKLGIPLSGCKVYTYEPNSNIPKTTWVDIDKTVENTNPILLDAAGEADIFLDGLYQIIVKDRFGFTVYDVEKTGYTLPELDDSLLLTWSGRTQDEKNKELISIHDFDNVSAAIHAAVVNSSLLLLNDVAFTLTVGTGGNFSKLSDALAQAAKMKLNYKNGNIGLIEIKLQSGYSLDEQIIVRDGQDLSFCVIRSIAPVVPISITPTSPDFADSDSNNAIFIAYNGAKLPAIGAKFQYGTTGVSDGVAVLRGSTALFEPGAGILGCRNGLKVLYGSEAYCYMQGLTIGGEGAGAGDIVGVQFPGCSNRGLHVAYGSRVGLARSNFSGCSGHNAYVIWNSFGDLYQSDFSGCLSADQPAVYIRDGSVVCMREACVSDNTYIGLHVLHGAAVDARSRISAALPSDPNYHKWVKRGYRGNVNRSIFASYGCLIEAAEACADNTQGRGVDAADGSTVVFTDGSAQNCTSFGVFAQRGSMVTALNVDVTGSVNGLVAISGSTISAQSAKAIGCNMAVNAETGSTIDATNAICTGATSAAIRSIDSTVCANGANVSNSKNGVYANGGVIQFKDGVAQGCTETGVGAYEGGSISASRANTSGCNRGFEASAATVVAKSCVANNCIERGLSVIDGGHINAYSATITGSIAFAVSARNGSELNITDANLGSSIPNCQTGSTIVCHNYVTTGTDSNVYNTVTSNGVMFK